MDVILRSSNGSVLGLVSLEGNTATLSRSVEVAIWAEEARRLARDLDHMAALRSGTIHWSDDDPVPRLSDGTRVTEQMMLDAGWRRTEEGWALP